MLTASRRALRPTLEAWLSRWGILDWLRLLWCTSVLWCEFLSFVSSLWACTWPDGVLFPAKERPAHILIVADPQARDPSTSNAAGLAALRQRLVQFTLRRNWFFASRNSPDVVVFLGDMLASWRLIRSDEDYQRNYNKFLQIFRLDRRIQSFFVPGNNDVGLNIDSGTARQARNRFTTHFGPLNQRIVVRNHTLVMLDAAGLVEEDYLRAAKYIDYEHWTPMPHGPIEFVHDLREAGDANPTILFTHIPLHRPDTASCGPLREKGTIRRGVGPSYQNTLGKKTTTFLLQNITPQIVFSADDKDYCDYVHVPPRDVIASTSSSAEANSTEAAKPQKVREITLKAFSPSSEIRHPGFQLLSLTSPPSSSSSLTSSHYSSLATTACFLPDYPSVYPWRYIPLFLLTTLTLIILRRRKFRTLSSLPTHLQQSALSQSFSINSLPAAPWSPQPHPPTPFSPDWSPHTPAFYTPRPRTPHSAGATSPSPKEEFPQGSLRAPLLTSTPSSPRAASWLNGIGNGDHHHQIVTTPTFRATALPRGDGAEHHLPTGPAHLDADELDDDFPYGQGDRHTLRVKLERDYDASGDVSAFSPPVDAVGSGLGITFTLNGRRRRVSLWNPFSWRSSGRGHGYGTPGLVGRRRSKRAFAKRVGMDLVYILWPAATLWVVLAWLVC